MQSFRHYSFDATEMHRCHCEVRFISFTSVSFSLPSPVLLREYTTLPVRERLGSFQFLDVINGAA